MIGTVEDRTREHDMPRRQTPLYLHEEILLLALRDEKGTLIQECSLPMGGAVLAELLLARRIAVTEDRKKLVDVLSSKRLGDPILDESLEKIATAKRRASLQTWVARLANLKKLRHRVAAGLCQRGVLRADEDKILLIFTRRIYPELDPRPERKLIERLRKAIFTEVDSVDARTVVLLSLAHTAELLKIPFPRKELRRRKRRIKELTSGNLLGAATKEAVQAAIAAAAMVPIMAACTASTT